MFNNIIMTIWSIHNFLTFFIILTNNIFFIRLVYTKKPYPNNCTDPQKLDLKI